ncbi:MAG: UvrD-helicase domain-containing protein [Jatrophihabitans sp.]|uniref:UvrD-helicase domain-containing protein n=1 Tax=Jatrophihabitans sp. TaxID=1932789 RepID=UPI0039103FC7
MTAPVRTTGSTPMIGAVELSKRLGLEHAPTDEQAAVIEAPLGPSVVIAGAGSGKTETMAARVVWLVANRLVTPDAVLGLTFTRKAAAELGRRVRRRLAQWRLVLERDAGGDPDATEQLAQLLAGEPTVLTYAAYAGRLVAEHSLRVGFEPDSRLISPAVGWQLADQVSRNHPDALPEDIGARSSVPRYVLDMSGQLADHLARVPDVGRLCSEMLDWFETLPLGKGIRSPYPGETAKFVDSLRHRLALLPLVQGYADAKAALAAVDFADQMTVAAEVAQLPEVQQIERSRFAAVLLDEYQDTGHAQIKTLCGLFGGGHPVTAVGDPFQSIYGWRGASAGNMGRFAATFARADGRPADVYPLATSFRNDEVILQAANEVAAPLRAEAASVELRAAPHAGPGLIAAARTETVEDEARWLADRMRSAWDELPGGDRTAAVLVRRRSQIPILSEALQAAGLPVEIVGLGGLLTTPEVVDVVATLRVLVHHDAGTALARLLTGARWRVGPRDLAALSARARQLGRMHAPTPPPVQGNLFGGEPELPVPTPPREPIGIVEALDDLGPPGQYSTEGYVRMTALADELRRLRRRVSAPLPDLVADVERAIGVDLEVAARADRVRIGRAHLDRFLDESADFANEADEATLTAFLAYLEAAEDEENGLDAGEVVVESERVQVLTVHGAKGLEWDVVAVPGLVDCVFPAEARSVNWTRARQEIPAPLRGDRGDLPELRLDGAADRKQVRDRLIEQHAAVLERQALEERRLCYVALTRARHTVFASGYVWDTAIKPRAVSPFLEELRPHATIDEWVEAGPDAANPLIAEAREVPWPIDPFGPYPGDRGPGRRADVEAGAALVRAAQSGEVPPTGEAVGTAGEWRGHVDRLLAERSALAQGDVIDVVLPQQLSVSQLVELRHDPAALARALRRPVPHRPAPWARRGTAFHTWLEQRWQKQTLLDMDELPGAADEGADDSEFLELRAAFEASEWAQRTPAEVEVPFEMTIGERVVRGRMDAVFRDSDSDSVGDDGSERWLVVDWKTGRKPTGAAAAAAAVQLAAYRLAWARLNDIPDAQLHRVRAAFHYVRSSETVEPNRLLDADGLRALIVGGGS